MIASIAPNTDLELDTEGISVADLVAPGPNLGEPETELERLSVELSQATVRRLEAERRLNLLRNQEHELADRIKAVMDKTPDPNADRETVIVWDADRRGGSLKNPEPEVVQNAAEWHGLERLDIADGWIKKLKAAGVETIEQLCEFISAGKLVPGALPRVGPEAVGKIKAACQVYAKERGWPSITVTPPEPVKPAPQPKPETPVAPVPVATQTLEETREEGAQMALNGFGTEHNPWKYGTPSWQAWDAGWQENYDPSKFPEFQEEAKRGKEAPRSQTPVARETNPVPSVDAPAPVAASNIDDDLADL